MGPLLGEFMSWLSLPATLSKLHTFLPPFVQFRQCPSWRTSSNRSTPDSGTEQMRSGSLEPVFLAVSTCTPCSLCSSLATNLGEFCLDLVRSTPLRSDAYVTNCSHPRRYLTLYSSAVTSVFSVYFIYRSQPRPIESLEGRFNEATIDPLRPLRGSLRSSAHVFTAPVVGPPLKASSRWPLRSSSSHVSAIPFTQSLHHATLNKGVSRPVGPQFRPRSTNDSSVHPGF